MEIASSESQSSLEKQEVVNPTAKNVDLEQVGETQGYVLDENHLKHDLGLPDSTHLKTAPDGHTVLIPQPTDDPNDPLNWPEWKKWATLAVISIASINADYGSATGATLLLVQAEEWHLSPNTINHATAGNIFMLGAGGLFVVWFSAYFGRLPVLMYFEVLTVVTAAWCAAAKSFESYMAARILNGFFSSAAAAGGLMFIKDIYYFHQHPRKINIWATALILSPFLAPLVAALIITKTTWRWAFWTNTMIAAIGLILTWAVADETFYPRKSMPDRIPQPKSRIMRLLGIEQRRNGLIPNTFLGAGSRLIVAISKLPVLLSTIWYFLTFAWVIGNNITISVFIIPMYQWGYRQLALIYLAPVVGCALGLITGHWLHDFFGNLYTKRHNGRIIPEARLLIIWLATPLVIIGMNMIGATLQHRYHYMVLAVGWALHNYSIIIVTTAINAYVLDAYPEGSGEVAGWLNAGRTIGGFVVGYFQLPWALATGTQTEFGVQSVIVAVAFGIVAYLQFFGPKLREKQGPMNFKTQ